MIAALLISICGLCDPPVLPFGKPSLKPVFPLTRRIYE